MDQVRTGVLLVQKEGLISLWSGLPPALARGFLYGGLRLGLYSPIKTALASAGGGASASGEALQPSFMGKVTFSKMFLKPSSQVASALAVKERAPPYMSLPKCSMRANE